jgi:hypothetical protein
VNAVKATWTNGQILPGEPVNWPEGSELVVEPVDTHGDKTGLDESEWTDDSAAMNDWDSWLTTIEPLVLTPNERAAFAAFEAKMREHNLDAVRRQMEIEGI